MADLTADRHDKRQEGVLIDLPYGDNTIYAGALVCANSGVAVKADNAKSFIGVAMEGTDTAKSEGRDYIRIWVEGTFEFAKSSAAAADLGKAAIVGADDNTVAVAAGTETIDKIVGKIVEITSTSTVRVKLGL